MGDAYVRRLNELKTSLGKVNSQVKTIKEKLKETTNHLYSWMEKRGLEEYQGFKLEKLKPKPRKQKKKSEKKQDALKFFQESGVEDPESFWNQFQETQKYNENNEIKED